MTLIDRIRYALEDGINIKRLLLVSGLTLTEFYALLDDDLFSEYQREAILKEIKEWRKGQ